MRYNVPKSCATRVCCACVDLITCVAVRYLTLRTGCEKHGRKNPLPFLFSKRSHVGNLRQTIKQGKGRSSKRKENRRLSFLFAPRRGRGDAPAVRRRRIPPLRFSEKLPARQGRTRLRQFVCPGQPAQKRSRPSGTNPPAAVRVPRSADAEKEPPVRVEPACGSSCALATLCREKKHRRIASTVLKVCTFTQIAAAYRHPYAPAPAGPVPDDRAR